MIGILIDTEQDVVEREVGAMRDRGADRCYRCHTDILVKQVGALLANLISRASGQVNSP